MSYPVRVLEVYKNNFNPTVQHLVDVCVPTRFNLAVSATKEASGFDP